MPTISRRHFLQFSTRILMWCSGLLGLAGILRFLSYQPPAPPPKRFEVGHISSYPVGTRTLLPDIPAILVRTEGGLSAISLVCPHLGCTVEQKAGALVCPCHGSSFDKNGKVTKGPAADSLETLAVEQDEEGNLAVIKG